MINDVLTEETIQFKKRCSSWDEALDLVAKPLLDNGNIKESYIVKIKGNLADFGEYIMLRDGFALPHARPEDGVEKMGMSFLKLEEPVFLSDNKKYPIYVIVMLAAIDSHKHLHALSNLVDCIAEDEDFAELLTINSASELYEFIERHTK